MGEGATTAMASELIASNRYRAVVGLGASGLSVARFLHRRGEPFVVLDTRPEPPGLEALRAEMPEVSVFTGELPQGVPSVEHMVLLSDDEEVVKFEPWMWSNQFPEG